MKIIILMMLISKDTSLKLISQYLQQYLNLFINDKISNLQYFQVILQLN